MQIAQKLLSTRGGTVAVSALAALLAGTVLLVYLHRYRSSLNDASQPVSVLVAKSLIEKGTSGSAIGATHLFQVSSVPRGELKDGAVTDPGALRDKVAVDDIYPGEQLTTADFTALTGAAIPAKLAADERALSVPLDPAHGLIGKVQPGDHVDVLAGFNIQRIDRNGLPVDQGGQARPVLKVILQDILVLAAPEQAAKGFGSGTASGNVTLEVSDQQAADLAFASDNGKVWIMLRPKTGARQARPSLVTLETILLGVKPVRVLRSFGGQQ